MEGSEEILLPSSLWNFVKWDSIWPLPHVILAYHAYLYTRNWISVLCFYYLLKTIQLLLFSLLGIGYDHYFAELLNSAEPNTYTTTTNIFPTNESNNAELYGCLVDFNGLFVGGTIQTMLGIMLGMVHSYMFAPSIYKVKNFHPVTFWKSPATKHQSKFLESKRILEKHTKARSFWTNYGLWPWHLWFGQKTTKNTLPCRNDDDILAVQPGTSRGQEKKTVVVLTRWQLLFHLERRWSFRKHFWQRWLQMTLLGSPCLLFYTIGGENIIRVGSVAYGFVTSSLLLWYRLYNEAYYVRNLGKKTYQNCLKSRNIDNVLLHILKQDVYLIFNSYDTIYSAWILTCVALIVFQSIPIPSLTAFYKVIISSVLVLLLSVVLYLLPQIINKLEKKRQIHNK